MPGPEKEFTPEERARQGNPGRRPTDIAKASEPADYFPPAPTTYPPVPEELLAGEGVVATRAREIWDSLICVVCDARVYRDSDAFAFGRYCRYLAEWIEYNTQIDEDGLFMTDHNGALRRHPAVIARKTVEDAMEKLEAQFGLQPAHRLRITKQLAANAKDLPLVGKSGSGQDNRGGPVGFLSKKGSDDDA